MKYKNHSSTLLTSSSIQHKMMMLQFLLLPFSITKAFSPQPQHRHHHLYQPYPHPSSSLHILNQTPSTEPNGINSTPTSTSDVVSQRSQSVESFKVMDVLQRANQLESEGHKVLHCEVGQPESGAPSIVANAAVEALTGPPRQVLGYTDAFGILPLREKIIQHYKDKYALNKDDDDGNSVRNGSGRSGNLKTDHIVITTGSSGGFLLAFTAAFDEGDVVAIASSGYPCYRNILSALGCELCNVNVNHEFKLTAVELKREIQRRVENGETKIKGLILSSPSNPTGAMLSPEELKDLCELCDEEGITFLSDEIYHGISYGKEEATALDYSENCIVINSFSKYYSSKFFCLLLYSFASELS